MFHHAIENPKSTTSSLLLGLAITIPNPALTANRGYTQTLSFDSPDGPAAVSVLDMFGGGPTGTLAGPLTTMIQPPPPNTGLAAARPALLPCRDPAWGELGHKIIQTACMDLVLVKEYSIRIQRPI